MIIKQCQFSGIGSNGPLVHLLHPGYDNDHLIKTAAASPPQLSQIQRFLKTMSKKNGSLYVLVSALGAGEYWGSNSNGDYFGEEPLLHTPPDWMCMPHHQQKLVGKRWEWGYPTFYNAHAFQHHVNKDPARAFGEVEYVLWDPHMKRVLLVIGIDRARARLMGAHGVVDRIENGEFPDVSMGCKVPYDVCSICADWSRITKNPRVDLMEHRRRPITGVSTVTSEYCQHLQNELNKIYNDGRKVKMLNIHPRFFDLSLVFIGADKTSKVLAKLAHGECPIRVNSPMCKQGCTKCSPNYAIPSSHVHEVWSKEKTAERPERSGAVAVSTTKPKKKKMDKRDRILKEAFGDPGADDYIPEAEQDAVMKYYRNKHASPIVKRSEIVKRIKSHFSGKALPALQATEPDMPEDVQDRMSDRLSDSLSTCGGMGIVAKPREFQRMYIRAIGKPELADDLHSKKIVFRSGKEPSGDFGLSGSIIPSIIKSLLPMMASRSAFGPPLHRRVVIIINKKPPMSDDDECECMDHPLLDKVSSAYSAYRRDLIYKTASLVSRATHENPQITSAVFGDALNRSFHGGLAKQGSNVLESIIGMLPATYLNRAYMNGPVSGYVEDHSDLTGIITAGDLASVSGAA